MVQRSEEQAALGVALGLDLARGVVEPRNLVLAEPAGGVLGVELGGSLGEGAALVEGRVHGLVGEVEEERPLALLLQEGHRVGGQQVGGVDAILMPLDELSVPVPGLRERALAVAVVVHAHGAGERAIAGLEPELPGAVLTARAQVPLAAQVGVVPLGREHAGEGRRTQGEGGRVAGLHGRAAEASGVAAGHERHARGRALGHRVVRREQDAFRCQRIHVRGVHGRVVGPEVRPALVVGEDDQDIGRGACIPRLVFHGSSTRAQGGQQDEPQGPEGPG